MGFRGLGVQGLGFAVSSETQRHRPTQRPEFFLKILHQFTSLHFSWFVCSMAESGILKSIARFSGILTENEQYSKTYKP